MDKFSKTTITIRLILLQVFPSLLCTVFAVSFTRSSNFSSGYFDDSLNFSGCNSHCLSFDTEFRDTAPLTLLLVVNDINTQGRPCADHRRPLWNPVVVIVLRIPKRYSYLYMTGF